jgi:PAS domain S-box-containing protein
MTISRAFTSRAFAFLTGAFVSALSFLALLGWQFGIPTLSSALPVAASMKPNAAVGLCACGLAVAMLSRKALSPLVRYTAAILASIAALIGAATLVEYLFASNLRIDQLLFLDTRAASDAFPGRPSLAIALCFIVSGIALLCLCLRTDLRWRNPIVSALAATVAATGIMVLLAALSDKLLGTSLPLFAGVAIHTAFGFLFLGTGLLALVKSDAGLVWAIDSLSTAGILIGILCLLFVAISASVFTHELEQSDLWIDHTQEVLKHLISVDGASSDIETATRNYIVSGDESYLAQRAPARIALQQHLDTIRHLTSDNPTQQARLDQLATLSAEHDGVMEQLIANRRQSGLAAAEASPAAAQERQLSDQARELRKQMPDEEYRLLNIRRNRTLRLADRTFLFLPLGLFLSLMTMAIALFFLNAGLHGRLQAELALRAANEHLRATENRFRLLISGIKDYAIVSLDPLGNVAIWNAGAQDLTHWTAAEVIGQPFSVFYSSEEQSAGKPALALATAIAAGRFEEQGWRFRKDGSRFWAEILITPIHDERGQLAGFATLARDRTEHRRSEQAMQEKEARHAAVIGSAMDAVITVDASQRITLFNPAAEKIFGYLERDVLGQTLDRLMPQRFRAGHARHIDNFAQTNITRRRTGEVAPIYGLRSDGEEFPIEASISQAEVQGQRIFSVILRDVSERSRADEALRQQAKLLDLAPVLVLDRQNRIVFWSSSLEKLYGYSREQAVGRISRDLLQTEFPAPIAQIESSLELHGSWEGELTQCSRDGVRVVVNSLWVLYRDSQGQPSRILELNADITARKRAEALQARSQKLESLGTLAGGIAHDFNNILLAISGNAKLAIADLPPGHPIQENLAEITKAASRATDLVRRILAFSRHAEVKRQIVSLQPVVEEALKLVRATFPATISVRASVADPLPAVFADASQIHQIIVNLATNAAHAIGNTSDGLIEVRLDAATLSDDDASPAINLPPGEYVRLLVSDNGCGMDRATLERVYDPFFTTKPVGEGTGLGLSVVHGIVKNHEGGITAYSEPGRGTAFRLYFPTAGPAAPERAQPAEEFARVRTENILYVDDEEPLVALVTRTLKRLGYKVTGQTSPLRAVELFRSNPAQFDAVVTDLAMPELSGFDFAAQLLALRPNLPIIMTSGYVRSEDQERALRMGLRDVILKPDTIEQLGRTLDLLFQNEAGANFSALRPSNS